MNEAPNNRPPRWADWLRERFCAPEKREEVLGDLHERYHRRAARLGATPARRQYARDMLSYLQLWVMKTNRAPAATSLPFAMFKHYLTIALRYLVKHKAYATSTSVGLTVALLIGLWLHDELAYNHSHAHYRRIVRVMENEPLAGGIQTFSALPLPLSQELRTRYAADFQSVAASKASFENIVAYQNQKVTRTGSYAESQLPEMLTPPMLAGTRTGLRDPASVLLSESLARTLFGARDPMGKAVTLGNKFTVQVRGVYRDLPANSTFSNVAFIAPIGLLLQGSDALTNWRNSSFQMPAAKSGPGR